jgi:hypothetical protein
MLKRLLVVAALIGVSAAVVHAMPDIRRYLKIRKM